MEKLELKHLVPYLPYGLKIRVRLNRFSCGAGGKLYTDKDVELTYKNITKFQPMKHYNSVKPILRPLSEIKQFEDIMDEFSEFSWNAFEEHFLCNILGRSLNCFDNVNYTIMELCFKHHLDIFGLIDKGLAVSYSDVESSSNEG